MDFWKFLAPARIRESTIQITDNLVICGFSWVSILEGQITQNKSKDNHHAQRKPPKENSPVSISVFISMSQTTSARCFFQQLPTLNHHALRPESRYISPNCFQSLPLHPCHGPTDVPSAYREQRNMCMYIQMCIYNVCVWVCLKIMDFPKTVQEMASFVSNQLDLRVSNFWMPMYGYFFSYLLL